MKTINNNRKIKTSNNNKIKPLTGKPTLPFH